VVCPVWAWRADLNLLVGWLADLSLLVPAWRALRRLPVDRMRPAREWLVVTLALRRPPVEQRLLQAVPHPLRVVRLPVVPRLLPVVRPPLLQAVVDSSRRRVSPPV